ncbi:MAG: hypothetical protein H7318_07920 [Oligoflexus sp.]|nr:hypothetical protein [Oligoflexus sp.]
MSKNGLIGPPASNSIANIPKGDELSYELKLHLQQKPFDHDEIEGQFASYRDSGETGAGR